jgi:hypothetical protein
MTDTYSEQYRHECEVREVASWKTQDGRNDFNRMVDYFSGVRHARGKLAAERLTNDVRKLLVASAGGAS